MERKRKHRLGKERAAKRYALGQQKKEILRQLSELLQKRLAALKRAGNALDHQREAVGGTAPNPPQPTPPRPIPMAVGVMIHAEIESEDETQNH